MTVKITEYLRGDLLRMGIGPDSFIEIFAEWKRGPEDGHYYFGKDAEYRKPLINGKRLLRHVHLAPLADSPSSRVWDRNWDRYRRRTSDTALVYADGGRHGYLLIAVFWEPHGHSAAEMRDQVSIDTMNGFANVAGHFIFNGSIVT